MRQPKSFIRRGVDDAKAEKELRGLLRALLRDAADQPFDLGKFSCRKKLSNGYIVYFSYREPRQ